MELILLIVPALAASAACWFLTVGKCKAPDRSSPDFIAWMAQGQAYAFFLCARFVSAGVELSRYAGSLVMFFLVFHALQTFHWETRKNPDVRAALNAAGEKVLVDFVHLVAVVLAVYAAWAAVRFL